jgi:hypothetical protein
MRGYSGHQNQTAPGRVLNGAHYTKKVIFAFECRELTLRGKRAKVKTTMKEVNKSEQTESRHSLTAKANLEYRSHIVKIV